MSDWDADRVRERTEVTSVFFGGTNQYSPDSVTPESSPIANLETLDSSYLQFNASFGDQVEKPVSNMNFTTGDESWIFEKDPVSRDVAGYFTNNYGNPSPGSGSGSIYIQMTGLSTSLYWMNWTYRFSCSQSAPSATYFSWAKMVWSTYLAEYFTAYVVMTLPNDSLSVISGPINLLSLNLTTWYYESIELNSSIITSPGDYVLTLAVLGNTTDSGNPHDSGNAVVFFDDVGISAVYYGKWSTDFYGTFNTGQDPNILRKLQVYYGGHYSAPALQELYLMDYANNQWHLLVTSQVSTNDEVFGPIEISENVNDYADSQGTVLLRVASESEESVDCQANFMMIRLYFVDNSKITLEVTNLGSEIVNLVRAWVNNSTGHSKIDLLAGVNIDREIISPGEKAIIQIDYPYSVCQYTFKVATKRGTVAAYVKTAS